MYLIVAGLVLLGAFCGATIRLLPFVVVLVGAAAIAGISAAVHGGGRAWLDTIIAVVALQVGYALGIVGRAMLRSWRQRRTNLVRSAAGDRVRLPTRQNHH
jgi:uncharacterized membrane protein YgdD (TMEM256/DUF423 family)